MKTRLEADPDSLALLTLFALAGCAMPVATDEELGVRELAVLGGADADTRSYPSMVSLQARMPDGSFQHMCGATLIAPRWLLTAAHCMDAAVHPAISHAVIGRSDLGDEASGQRIALEPASLVVHASADLAVVRLSTAATKGVTARLASPELEAALVPGDPAWIVGWGWDGSAYPDQLQDARVDIVDRTLCQAQWQEQGGSVLPSELCAGVEDASIDTQPGDSGGPLFVADAAGLVLAGVTSWGDNDLDDELAAPGVYVSIAANLDWIQASTEDKHPLWLAGGSRGSFSNATRSAPSVALPVTGDFDADGKGDVLYYVPGTGKDSLVYGSGRNVALTVTRSYVPLVADFDADGYDEILWYGRGTATDTLWWNDAGRFHSQSVTVDGTYRAFTGDFDGDGCGDAFWYDTGDGADGIWWGGRTRSFTATSASIGGSYRPLSGDFDGDGADDVFWYAPGTTADRIWWGRTNRTFTATSKTVDGTFTAFTGDFDGDGRHDVFWYRPGSGADRIWFGTASRGWSSVDESIGGTYLPVVASFDAARGDDVLWYLGAPAKGF